MSTQIHIKEALSKIDIYGLAGSSFSVAFFRKNDPGKGDLVYKENVVKTTRQKLKLPTENKKEGQAKKAGKINYKRTKTLGMKDEKGKYFTISIALLMAFNGRLIFR